MPAWLRCGYHLCSWWMKGQTPSGFNAFKHKLLGENTPCEHLQTFLEAAGAGLGAVALCGRGMGTGWGRPPAGHDGAAHAGLYFLPWGAGAGRA